MSDENTNKLKQKMIMALRKKKSSKKFPREYPFPIIRNNCGENNIDPDWECIEGTATKHGVIVYDDESIKLLYTHGFFGKGSHSKDAPKVCFENKTEKKNDQPGPSVSKPPIVIEIDDEPDSKVIEEIVLSDSDDDTEKDFLPLRRMPIPVESADKENLILSFEEAFFLCYGLGCLLVKENDEYVSMTRLWLICYAYTVSGNFPAMYSAYHHFRSTGWVVRDGLKYGVDFLLYKDGPAFYHASFAVVVKPTNFPLPKKPLEHRRNTFGFIVSLQKANINVKKDLIYCVVKKPDDLHREMLFSPECLKFLKTKPVKVDFWEPSKTMKEFLNTKNE